MLLIVWRCGTVDVRFTFRLTINSFIGTIRSDQSNLQAHGGASVVHDRLHNETNMCFGLLHFFFICKLSSVFGFCSRFSSLAFCHGPRSECEDGTRGNSCCCGCVGIAAYYRNMSTNSFANSFHDLVRLVDLQSSECGPQSLWAQTAGWTPNVKPYRGTSPCQQQGAVGKRKLPQHQVGGDRGAGLFRIYVAQRNCFSWYLCTTSEK